MVGLALWGVGVILAGCGSPQPAASPAAAARVMLHTPEYEADGRTLVAAREILIGRCMATAGFVYQPATLPPPPPPIAMPSPTGGYGLFETMSAVEPAVLARLRTPNLAPQALYLEGLETESRARYERALNGSPQAEAPLNVSGGSVITYQTDGCHARATATLHGSLRRYHALGDEQNLAGVRLGARLSADVRFVAAAGQWRSCMSARGVPHPSPEGARDAAYAAYVDAADPTGARDREMTIAAADRDCAAASGIYAERARAEQEAVASLPTELIRSMTTLAHRRAAAAEKARAVLAEPLRP